MMKLSDIIWSATSNPHPQSDLGLRCLSWPFGQATSAKSSRTSIVHCGKARAHFHASVSFDLIL